VGLAACGTAGVAQAAVRSGGGYGPSGGGTTLSIPGGYASVAATVTVGPAGGTIGPVSVDGAGVTVSVPAGAFPERVQVTLYAPYLSGIPALPGYQIVAGVGVQVTLNGQPYRGAFLKPLTVTVSSARIGASSVVQVWNGSSFVTDSASSTAAGSATLSVSSDPYFVIQTPVSATWTPISGATSANTGEPFLGEGIAAGTLLVAGSAGLAMRRRRRTEA
jgi:hypothetical protein